MGDVMGCEGEVMQSSSGFKAMSHGAAPFAPGYNAVNSAPRYPPPSAHMYPPQQVAPTPVPAPMPTQAKASVFQSAALTNYGTSGSVGSGATSSTHGGAGMAAVPQYAHPVSGFHVRAHELPKEMKLMELRSHLAQHVSPVVARGVAVIDNRNHLVPMHEEATMGSIVELMLDPKTCRNPPVLTFLTPDASVKPHDFVHHMAGGAGAGGAVPAPVDFGGADKVRVHIAYTDALMVPYGADDTWEAFAKKAGAQFLEHTRYPQYNDPSKFHLSYGPASNGKRFKSLHHKLTPDMRVADVLHELGGGKPEIVGLSLNFYQDSNQ